MTSCSCSHTVRETSVIRLGGMVAQCLEHMTGDRGVQGSNPAGGTSLQNFGNSVYRCLPEVSLPGEVKDPTQGANV